MTNRKRPHKGGTRNEFPGTATNVVQARDIQGDLHLYAAPATNLLVPRQLPADDGLFTGRDSDLAILDDLLNRADRPSAMVISAVAGAAGVGKTALAVHWAHRVRHLFAGGDLYVNLRGYDSGPSLIPQQALDSFLRALGVLPDRIPQELEAQSALFRTLLHARRMLVVLDNANSADQVRPLLPASPECLVVVTSRSQMAGLAARDGARRMTLSVLPTHEAVALLRRIIGADRVDIEPEAAIELASRCVCLPLALRIAGEHAAGHPQAKLADVAGGPGYDRLDALATLGDERTAVREVFSWSYRALQPRTARVFRLLGTYPGQDMSIPVVAALAGTSLAEARRLLDTLSDVHLLEQASPARYRFHDLLRLYAAECACADESAEDLQAAARRALVWYLQTADAANRIMIPRSRDAALEPAEGFPRPLDFDSTSQAMSWCETERSNLIAAVRQAADIGESSIAWELAAALWSFFTLSKHWSDWITTYEIALTAARNLQTRRGEVSILNGLGVAHWELRRFDLALSFYNQALTISDEVGDRLGEGRTLNNIGDVHWSLGRFDEADDYYRRSLVLRRETGDRWGEANTLHNLSDNYRDRQRFGEAIDCYQQALVIWQETGDRWGEGATLSNLGSAYQRLGQLDKALDYYQRSLVLRRETCDRWGEADTLNCMGEVLSATGRAEAARECFQQALAILDSLGAPRAAEVRGRLQSPMPS